MKHSNILRTLSVCLLGLLAASSLAAQQREWTVSDGVNKFKAELVNAYGDTVFFQKEDGGFIHMPVVLLSKPDVARVVEWARERDAQKRGPLYSSQAMVTKDVCSAWLNGVVGETLKDVNVGQYQEPNCYAFLMIKKSNGTLYDTAHALANAEKAINAKDDHFIQIVTITSLKGEDIKSLIFMLGKTEGNWLMQGEWSYKDKKDMWNGYWRMPDVNVLVLDPQGHVLCDGSAKDPDGKKSDPIAFLGKMETVAQNIRDGGNSVPNPYVNAQAVKNVLARELAAKTNKPQPQPVVFDFSGVDADIFKVMEGNDYVVSVEIGTNGTVSNLVLKKGGDATIEQALKQASALWQFIPGLKDGEPVAKTVVIPIRIKAPAPAKPAA